MSQHGTKPYLVLLLTAAIWGASFPMMKLALSGYSTDVALFLRFTLATLILLPWCYKQLAHREARRYGLGIGALMYVIYTLMATALNTISAARCAFLMSTTVVLVQLPSLFKKGRPNPLEWLCATTSLAGVVILTNANPLDMARHDLLVLCAAALSAVGLILVHRATAVRGLPGHVCAFYQIASIAAGAGLMVLIKQPTVALGPTVPTLALLYCAVAGTAAAQIMQMRYQRFATPAVAAMIFALKPVFATVATALLFKEAVSTHTFFGGSLMVGSAFLPPFYQWLNQRRAAVAKPPVPAVSPVPTREVRADS